MSASRLRLPIGLCELLTLMLDQRARRALRGLMMLRRVYEHVLVMATVEHSRAGSSIYREGYLDTLNIIVAKAAMIARTL